MKSRFVVMVSGNGSNLQSLIDAIARGELDAKIVLVLSSDPDAHALVRARKAGIPTLVLSRAPIPGLDKAASRRAYDKSLAEAILPYGPDYIFLLGWMRILGKEFIAPFRDRIVNLHPALPGTFPGTHAIERAWDAFLRGEIGETGVMTHFVPDECVDAGPVIASERVVPDRGETFEAFEARMHEIEHGLVIRTAGILVPDRNSHIKGE